MGKRGGGLKAIGVIFGKAPSSEAAQAPHGTSEMLTLKQVRGGEGSGGAVDHAPLVSVSGLHHLETSSRGDQDRTTRGESELGAGREEKGPVGRQRRGLPPPSLVG